MILLLVAGLILLLAGQDWFDGAETVGWILVGVDLVILSLQVYAWTRISRRF